MLNIIRSRSRRKSKIENFDDSPDSGLESGGSINKYAKMTAILNPKCSMSHAAYDMHDKLQQ